LSLAAIGCQKPVATSAGELIGVYSITGALIDNTCGQSALPTQNPLRFEVEIRREDSVGYWQIEKRPARPGELEDDGTFRFNTEQTSLVSSMRSVRNDLEPEDFNSLNPDFDLKTTNCIMKMSELIEGTLERRFVDLQDGGVGDSKNKTDLSGDNVIKIEPTANSDCSAALAALGGSFENLPCAAHYKLKGELLESRAEPPAD
jgi:hypothetical protein